MPYQSALVVPVSTPTHPKEIFKNKSSQKFKKTRFLSVNLVSSSLLDSSSEILFLIQDSLIISLVLSLKFCIFLLRFTERRDESELGIEELLSAWSKSVPYYHWRFHGCYSCCKLLASFILLVFVVLRPFLVLTFLYSCCFSNVDSD